MKKHTIQSILTLLLAALLLTASACGEVDPLAPKSGDSESTDSSDIIVAYNPRPADADWSAFESGEDDGVNDVFGNASGVLAGDWFYPSAFRTEYGYADTRQYFGRKVQTAFKYNLTTREFAPFCMDATCRHSIQEKTSDCPFAGGCRVIAIDGDRLFYASAYPTSEDDSPGQFYHPSVYCYDMKTLGSRLLFSTFHYLQSFDYYQYLDGTIYYVEDELVGDYVFDRYLCACDLGSGKTERLLKIDGFRYPDPKHPDANSIVYDIGLIPRAVDRNGIAYFQTAHDRDKNTNHGLYIADLKKGGGLRLLPESDISGGIFGIYEGKIFCLNRAPISDTSNKTCECICCYDPASENMTVVAKYVQGSGRIYGDILWYLPAGNMNCVMMQNLKTGETQSIKLPESEEGQLRDIDTGVIAYKEGRLLFNMFSYKGNDTAGTFEFTVFDLVTGKLYPLHRHSPKVDKTIDNGDNYLD